MGKSDKSDTIKKEQARTTFMKSKFLEALSMDRIAGNVLVAANAVGISRDTAYDWRRKDEEFAEKWETVVMQAIDKRVEIAEDKLDEQVRKGNISAIIFTLKHLRPHIYNRKHSDDGVFSANHTYKPSPRFARVLERLLK